MKKPIQILFVLLFISLQTRSSFSQTTPEIPEVVPPSPEAASLFKYEEVPVGNYTGTVKFSIPIYTIEDNDLSLPISIEYHSGGIKVNEESSWVGLGWSLNAGGRISRSIIGKDDLGTDGYCDPNNPAPELPLSLFSDPRLEIPGEEIRVRDCEIIDASQTTHSFCSNGIFSNAPSLFVSRPNQVSDLMPDAFAYALPGETGKFFLNKQKEPILTKAGVTKILLTSSPTPTWEIRTGNGFRYLFELSGDVEFEDNNPNSIPTFFGPSSWPLTKIISPGGSEVIFEYHPVATITQHPTMSTSKEELSGLSNYACNITGVSELEKIDHEGELRFKEYYLKKIQFDKGYVEFVSLADRQDLEGSRRLTEINVYHYEEGDTNSPNLFQSSDINNNFYFQGVNSSNTLSMPDPNGYLEKRLKLESIDNYGNDLSHPPLTHSFTYFEGIGSGASALDPPNKHSFAQDYWGYYNGKNSNTMLVPEFNGFNPLFQAVMTLSGGDRSVDASVNQDYIKAGMLKKIQYPTGGTTDIDYESHSFSGSPPISSQAFEQIQPYYAYKDASGSSGIVPFSITASTSYVKWSVDLFYDYFSATVGSNGFLVDPDMLKIEVREVGNSSAVIEWDYYDCVYNGFLDLGPNYTGYQPYVDCQNVEQTLTTILPLGNYELEVTNNYTTSVNGSIPASITATIELGELSSGPMQNTLVLGGGVRVKQISSSAGSTSVPMTRYFNYHYFEDIDNDGTDEELSYGKLMSVPVFHVFSDAYDGDQVNTPSCIRFQRFSNSTVPYSTSANGFHIGYDKVEVTRDALSEQGKTVYQYHNESDIQYTLFCSQGDYYNTHRNVPTISFPKNGLLKAEYLYRSDGSGNFLPVKETQNQYMSEVKEGVYGISIFGSYPTEQPVHPNLTFSVTQEDVFLYRIPLISDWVYLSESKEITYDQLAPQENIEVNSSFTYDPVNYQVKSRSLTNSDQSLEQNKFKYSTDYDPVLSIGSGILIQDLIDRNMVSTPLETQSWSGPDQNNLSLISASVTSFKDYLSTTVVEDKVILPQYTYLLETTSPLAPGGFTESTNVNGLFTDLVPDPTYYKQRLILDYLSNGNISEARQNDGSPVSYIWGYNNTIPIAKILNAPQGVVAYTSFEDNEFGNWIYSGAPTTDLNSKTGNKVGNLSSSSLQTTITIPSGSPLTYTISYWKQGSAATVTGSSAPIISENSGLWTYYEHQISFSGSGTQNVFVSGSGLIDELRLHPLEAQMSTYCYDDKLRLHTVTDINSRSTYYLYDGLNRLEYVRDQDGNYVQSMEYNYKP